MQIDEIIKLLDNEERLLLEEISEKEIRVNEVQITKTELLKFKQQLKLKCDKCNGEMKKAFKSLTFLLKGQGWVSKGSGTTAGKPTKTTEVGIGIKQGMENTINPEIAKHAKIGKG